MGQKQKRKESKKREKELKKSEPDSSVTKKGEKVKDALDELDKMIDGAIGEEEGRSAQKFVDGFKQQGGE